MSSKNEKAKGAAKQAGGAKSAAKSAKPKEQKAASVGFGLSGLFRALVGGGKETKPAAAKKPATVKAAA